MAAPALLAIVAVGLVWRLTMDFNSLAGTMTAATSPQIDQSAETVKQITDALLVAKRDNKRVLLQFGSLGCSWCRLLHKAFDTNEPIAGELRKDYIVIMVDVSDGNNKTVDDQYGTPRHNSLPFTVILDSDDKPILAENIAFADDDLFRKGICQIDTDKVLALLKKYSTSGDHAA